jgi:hypothetical protein
MERLGGAFCIEVLSVSEMCVLECGLEGVAPCVSVVVVGLASKKWVQEVCSTRALTSRRAIFIISMVELRSSV